MSCNNNSKTEGISLHIFPRNKVFYNEWTRFVQPYGARSLYRMISHEVMDGSLESFRLTFFLDNRKPLETT